MSSNAFTELMGSHNTAQNEQGSSHSRRKDDAFDTYGATALEIQSERVQLVTATQSMEALMKTSKRHLDAQNSSDEIKTEVETRKKLISDAEVIESRTKETIGLIQKVLDDRERSSQEMDEESKRQIAKFKLLTPKLEMKVEKMLADHDHLVVQLTASNSSLQIQVGELTGRVNAYTSGGNVSDLKAYLEEHMKSLKDGNEAESIASANLRIQIVNLEGRLNTADRKKDEAESKERLTNQSLETLRNDYTSLRRQKEEAEENSTTWSNNFERVLNEKKELSAINESNVTKVGTLEDELRQIREELDTKTSDLTSRLSDEQEKLTEYSQRIEELKAEQKAHEEAEKIRQENERLRFEQEKARMDEETKILKSRQEEDGKAHATRNQNLQSQLATSEKARRNLEDELSRQKEIAETVPGLNQELQQQKDIASEVPTLSKELSRVKSIAEKVPVLEIDMDQLRKAISRINLEHRSKEAAWKEDDTKSKMEFNNLMKKDKQLRLDIEEKDAKIRELVLELETSNNVKEGLEHGLTQKDEIIRQKTSDNETLMLRVTHSDNIDDLKVAFDNDKKALNKQIAEGKQATFLAKKENDVLVGRLLRIDRDMQEANRLRGEYKVYGDKWRNCANEKHSQLAALNEEVKAYTNHTNQKVADLESRLLESEKIREEQRQAIEYKETHHYHEGQLDLLKAKEREFEDLKVLHRLQENMLERAQQQVVYLQNSDRFARLEEEVLIARDETKKLKEEVEAKVKKIGLLESTITRLNSQAFDREDSSKN